MFCSYRVKISKLTSDIRCSGGIVPPIKLQKHYISTFQAMVLQYSTLTPHLQMFQRIEMV
jgi:hypothetical protein